MRNSKIALAFHENQSKFSSFCSEVYSRYQILDERDENILITMQYFEKENTGKISEKTGKEIKFLKL